MLVVRYYPTSNRMPLVTYKYPHHYEPKILQSGTLKVYEPGDFEVPKFASEGSDAPDGEQHIAVKPARLVAIFNGNYTVSWNNEEEAQ